METEPQVTEQEQVNPPGEVESPAPAAEETPAESAPAEKPTPEGQTGAPDSDELPEKVQKRIDEIAWQKFEAQRERDYWKLQAEKRVREEQTAPVAPEPPPLPPAQPPRQEDFQTYEAYDEALFDWRFQQRVARERAESIKTEQERQQRDQQERARTWAEQGTEKYPDFARIALDETLKITPFMAQGLQDSEVGHDIAYYLGKNPKEAARIAKLPPITQVREIGRLEIKIQTPKQRETTAAPAPTRPVGGNEAPSVKLEDMTYEQYRAYRLKQLTGGNRS